MEFPEGWEGGPFHGLAMDIFCNDTNDNTFTVQFLLYVTQT